MKVVMSLRFLFFTARKLAPRPNFTFKASTLHLNQKTSPPQIFEKWAKTFAWSFIFGKLSKCEKPPAHSRSPLFLGLRLFHLITTKSDALPKFKNHLCLVSSTWVFDVFISSFYFAANSFLTFNPPTFFISWSCNCFWRTCIDHFQKIMGRSWKMFARYSYHPSFADSLIFLLACYVAVLKAWISYTRKK